MSIDLLELKAFDSSVLQVEEYAAELNMLVDKITSLGSLTLECARRGAFGIMEEDVHDINIRETLRHFYAPILNQPGRMRLLDGGTTIKRP